MRILAAAQTDPTAAALRDALAKALALTPSQEAATAALLRDAPAKS
jgi:hypothetical protein